MVGWVVFWVFWGCVWKNSWMSMLNCFVNGMDIGEIVVLMCDYESV